MALIDLPGSRACPQAEPTQRLQQAKRAHLLSRCADGLHANLLLVADAAATPQDAARIGRALANWVNQTQGKPRRCASAASPPDLGDHTVRSTRGRQSAPRRRRTAPVGEPGDSWATLLALDEQDCRRMVSYGRPCAPGPEASAPARTARRVAARADGKPARQLAHRHRSTRGAATRPAAAASAAGAGRPPRRTAGTAVTAARYVAPALSATAARRAGPDGDASAVRSISICSAHRKPRHPASPRVILCRAGIRGLINHLRSLPDSRRLLELLGVEKPHRTAG